MDDRRLELGRVFRVGVRAFLLAELVAFGVSLATRASGPFPVTMAMGAVVIGAVALTPRLARADTARTKVVAAIASLAFLPVLFTSASIALGQALAPYGTRCGTGDLALFVIWPVAVAICAGLTFPLGAIVAIAGGRRASAVLAALAMAAATGVTALVLAAIARHVRAPEPDAFAASFGLDAEPYSMDPARLSAPIGWIVEAALGLAFATASVAWMRRATRAAREHLTWRQATHVGGGMLEMDDGSTLQTPAAAHLACSPVLVRVERTDATPFRGAIAGSSVDIVSGQLDWLRERVRDEEMGAYALALASTVLFATPLVVAAFRGLVF